MRLPPRGRCGPGRWCHGQAQVLEAVAIAVPFRQCPAVQVDAANTDACSLEN
jgi:hypothetical protein